MADGRLSICIGTAHRRRTMVVPGQPLRRHGSGLSEAFASIASARDIREQRLIEMLLAVWCRDAGVLFWARPPRALPYWSA